MAHDIVYDKVFNMKGLSIVQLLDNSQDHCDFCAFVNPHNDFNRCHLMVVACPLAPDWYFQQNNEQTSFLAFTR